MRRPSFNPFLDYLFSYPFKREPRGPSGGRGRKEGGGEGAAGTGRGRDILLAENGRLKKKVDELKGRLSKSPKDGRGEAAQDPVLLALHLAEEEVFDRKDYGQEAVIVTRDGRKLRFEKGS